LEYSPCSSSHPVAAVTITIAVANAAANLNAAASAVATKTAKRSLSAAAKVASAARAAIPSNRSPLFRILSFQGPTAVVGPFFVSLYLSMMASSL
jgi:hypothetical protein